MQLILRYIFYCENVNFEKKIRMDVPERELRRTKHDRTAPLRTPSHVGCAFAIDREFFFEIGSYDTEMDIWGSENVELAFRVSYFKYNR